MQAITAQALTRRHFLRLLPGGLVFFTVANLSEGSLSVSSHQNLIDRFLGESLFYQIGFWLIPRCGAAQTSFLQTDHSHIYRAVLEDRTTGIIDALVGRIRYSYVSYTQYVDDEDRLKPVYFQFRKRHMQKESIRSVAYDYKSGKIFYTRTDVNKEKRQDTEDMQKKGTYEDYLSLFYNFRHGVYGPVKKGRIYQIPLHMRKGMNPLELNIAQEDQTAIRRNEESDKIDKDYLLQFKVVREDVSSKSGDVEGWLSSEAMPVKGTVKDVIFFGDLWGVLDHREREGRLKKVPIPEAVRTFLSPDLPNDG